jgi:hypothetical protein
MIILLYILSKARGLTHGLYYSLRRTDFSLLVQVHTDPEKPVPECGITDNGTGKTL